MNFNERLRSLRLARGMTQSQLSKVLHYGCTAISNYESGRNEPSISDLKALANYFNVSLDYLLGNSDHACRLYEKNIRIKKTYLHLSLQLAKAAPSLSEEKQQLLSCYISWLEQANCSILKK